MGVIDLVYGSDAAIEDVLHSVDRPGEFCVHGKLYAPMPTLEVEGTGVLAFPVPESQLRTLIGVAERAPYGKGPQTVIDATVRNCWQIGTERIDLSGGAWADTFAGILETAATGLGCPPRRIEARLYKLLVYERGGFFTPHRDSEKAPGMIGTLTISLPVAGEGGQLIVRHRGREIVADMNVAEPSELAFAAFYADCPHEVRPVAAGHRLALIFNLCLRVDDGNTPCEPPDYGEQTDAIARHLATWSREDRAPAKIVWLLDHDYSEDGLSFETLKNGDAARARVLCEAADLADCEIHAAIVHIEEEGGGVYGDDYAHDFGWEPDEDDVEGMEIGDLFDSRHWLDGWAAGDGGRPALGEIELMPGELLPYGALDGEAPDDEWLHEATGNEGVSLERAWRRAGLVLWPRSRTLAILAGSGIGGAVAWLARRIEGGGSRADIVRLASEIVGIWPTGRPSGDEQSRTRMLGLLTAVGDGDCLSHFLLEVILPDYTGGENAELPAAMEAAEPGNATRFLAALVDTGFRSRPVQVLALLRRLDDERAESASSPPANMVRDAVRSVLRAVAAVPEPPDEPDTNPSVRKAQSPGRFPQQALRDFFILAQRCRLAGEAEAAAGAIAAMPRLVDPFRALPAALEEMNSEPGLAGTAAFATLWRHAAQSLLARSATPPKEPEHWHMACNVGCDCEPCKNLRAFCADPATRVARFPLRKELRAHLHRTIDDHGLDIDHETERRGRPFTLVCTKNRRSHERRLAEYGDDVAWMRWLACVGPGESPVPDRTQKMAELHAAVEASSRV